MNADLFAKYFIYKGMEEKRPISNKKLQKLLYYAQAWSLALKKHPMFKEKIRAWIHGPAIKEIYAKYKKFGFDPIVEKIDPTIFKKIPRSTKDLLDDVWNIYGKMNASYLEYLSHSEKPWQEARGGLDAGVGSDAEIALASMQSFFSEKISGQNTKPGKGA
jgi:uncharacterized phage-associated protein